MSVRAGAVLAAVCFVVSFCATARAQMIPPPVSLSSSPSSPAPRATFSVTAATPTFDKDFADFSWSVDGKPRPEFSGVGADTITLTAGAAGSPTRVSVSVSRPGGETADASLTIIPSELSLPWTAETSAPPWYRGKALPSPGAVVHVSAIPRIIIGGSALNPDTLIYRWRIDSDKESLTGAGKRVFTFTASALPGTTHQIDVSVEDIQGRIRKEGQVLITTDATPRVILYPSSPLGGTESRSAGAAPARPGLFDVVAEPFFFPLSSVASLAYDWSIDGSVVPSAPQSPRIATIDAARRAGEVVGIGVVARGGAGILRGSFSGFFNLFIAP
jgi:hypothetical protein